MSQRGFPGSDVPPELGAARFEAGAERREAVVSSVRDVEAWSSRSGWTGRRSALARAGATLAHQLGTPLNVIAGRTTMILRESSDPEVGRHAEIALEQVNRITGALRAFVDFVEEPSVESGVFGLSELLDGAMARVAPTARTRGVEVRVATHDAGRLEAAGPRERFVEVLGLLLERAVERTPSGGEVVLESGRRSTAAEELSASWPHGHVAVVVVTAREGRRARARHALLPPWQVDEDGEVGDLELHLAARGAREVGGGVDVDLRPGEERVTLHVPARPTPEGRA